MLEAFPEDWQRALAVVAHPDDLEYGAAAAVARWTAQGKTVTYLLASRGEAGIDGMAPADAGPVRETEERAGAAVVGVEVVEFLDHRDGVITYGLDLRRDIAAEIRRRRPDGIITVNHREGWRHGGVNMADHRAVGAAAIDAARDAGNRWVFPELIDEGLEPWSGVGWVGVSASPMETHAVDISDTIERGIESLRAHRAYLTGLGQDDPAGFLRGSAEGAASRFGGRLATTFELLML